jgi:hypothetical protein
MDNKNRAIQADEPGQYQSFGPCNPWRPMQLQRYTAVYNMASKASIAPYTATDGIVRLDLHRPSLGQLQTRGATGAMPAAPAIDTSNSYGTVQKSSRAA